MRPDFFDIGARPRMEFTVEADGKTAVGAGRAVLDVQERRLVEHIAQQRAELKYLLAQLVRHTDDLERYEADLADVRQTILKTERP